MYAHRQFAYMRWIMNPDSFLINQQPLYLEAILLVLLSLQLVMGPDH